MEKVNALFFKISERTRVPACITSITQCPRSPSQSNQARETQKQHTGKKEVKLALHAGHILYPENPKDTTKKF